MKKTYKQLEFNFDYREPLLSEEIERTLKDKNPEIRDPMATWVRNNIANNENPGTFKRLVEEDEKAYKKRQEILKVLEGDHENF